MVDRPRPFDAIEALQRWSHALANSGVRFDETIKAPAEYVFELSCVPPATDMSSLAIGLSKDGTSDITCATGLFLSDMRLQAKDLVQLCQAVAGGRVVEDRAECDGVLVSTTGHIALENGPPLVLLGHTKSFRWMWCRVTGRLRQRRLHYRPWPGQGE